MKIYDIPTIQELKDGHSGFNDSDNIVQKLHAKFWYSKTDKIYYVTGCRYDVCFTFHSKHYRAAKKYFENYQDYHDGGYASIELTDTFSGELNYSWVKRAKVRLNGKTTKQAIAYLKNELDLKGVRAIKSDYGDSIYYNIIGACVGYVITFDY